MQTEQNKGLLQLIAEFSGNNKWTSSIISIVVGAVLYLVYKIIFLRTFFSLPFVSELMKHYIHKLLSSAAIL